MSYEISYKRCVSERTVQLCTPVHGAQTVTYLRLAARKFYAPTTNDGPVANWRVLRSPACFQDLQESAGIEAARDAPHVTRGRRDARRPGPQARRRQVSGGLGGHLPPSGCRTPGAGAGNYNCNKCNIAANKLTSFSRQILVDFSTYIR